MDFLTNLGVDWKLLLAQVVNFLILLFLLKRFVYQPIFKMLKDREKRIEDSMHYAEKTEEKLRHADERVREVIAHAQDEAKEIMENARKEASDARAQEAEKTREELDVMRKKHAADIERERNSMVADVHEGLARLIVLASGKITAQLIDDKVDEALVEKTLRELEDVALD